MAYFIKPKKRRLIIRANEIGCDYWLAPIWRGAGHVPVKKRRGCLRRPGSAIIN